MILYAHKRGCVSMNKKEVIESKKEEIEEESDQIQGKMIRDGLIAGLAATSLIIPGLVLKGLFVNLSYPFFSLTTIIPTLLAYDMYIKKNMIEANNKEIKHLENIEKNGIKKSAKLDQARFDKINELKNSIGSRAKKDKIISLLSSIPLIPNCRCRRCYAC